MTLRLCVLLWEHEGRGHDLAAFEDAVLGLLPDYGGRLLSRDTVVDRHDGDPLEVQLIELPDEAALAGYLQDPTRSEIAHKHARDAVVRDLVQTRRSNAACVHKIRLPALHDLWLMGLRPVA